jgi:hypothetical protein
MGHGFSRTGLLAGFCTIDAVDANRPGTPGLMTGSLQPEELEDETRRFRLRALQAAAPCLRHAGPASVDWMTLPRDFGGYPPLSRKERLCNETGPPSVNQAEGLLKTPADRLVEQASCLLNPHRRNERVARPIKRRQNCCAPSTANRGDGCPEQTLAFGSDTRCNGGGGRRPTPFPPPENPLCLCASVVKLR